MSHFTVLVITDNPDNLEKLMAPYQENNMGDCPKEYLVFVDEEQEYRDRYETGLEKRVKLANGELVERYDRRCYVEVSKNRREWQLPEGAEEVEVPIKELYSSEDDYVAASCDYEIDKETGKRGYWENPNRKWDWYVVGGRWDGLLLCKDGTRKNVAKVKDVFFIQDQAISGTDPIEDIHRFAGGEELIKGYRVPELLVPEIKTVVDQARKDWNEVMSAESGYPEGYLSKLYGSEDDYVKEMVTISTYAVLTPDGKWHERGQMGWFGMSSETEEEGKAFDDSYYENFIKNANPNHYLILVDCHI